MPLYRQNAAIDRPPPQIGPYDPAHEDALLAAYDEALRDGVSFPRKPPATREDLRAVWIDDKAARACATHRNEFAGYYYVRANFPDRAGDIANAGYLVAGSMRGRGVGRLLLEHSLDAARQLGFRAMMFNLVFERNPARRLWEAAGFEVIGRIPGAIDGEQDADLLARAVAARRRPARAATRECRSWRGRPRRRRGRRGPPSA